MNETSFIASPVPVDFLVLCKVEESCLNVNFVAADILRSDD
jgi:hypothetical protein